MYNTQRDVHSEAIFPVNPYRYTLVIMIWNAEFLHTSQQNEK